MSEAPTGLETESLRWLARLDGEESAVDREAFERWRAAPGHAAVFERTERFWRGFDQLSGHALVERLTARALVENASIRKPFAGTPLTWALAASVTIVVCGAAAFIIGQHYTPTKTYTTEAGQRTTIQLEDGSEVVLNFATALDVTLKKDRRELKLRGGEAIFAVAEDPRRPFVVSAGDGEVTALGTRFQVRSDARRVTVTLLEGKVAVDRADTSQHVQLQPGDQVKFTVASAPLKRRAVNPAVVSSWTTGRLKFEVTPLAEVLEEVNRYVSTPIRVLDSSLAQTPVTGVFTVGDSESVVSGLQAMLPLDVARQDRREIVLIRR